MGMIELVKMRARKDADSRLFVEVVIALDEHGRFKGLGWLPQGRAEVLPLREGVLEDGLQAAGRQPHLLQRACRRCLDLLRQPLRFLAARSER